MAEMMGQLYGATVRIWVGVLGAFYSIVIATLQIKPILKVVSLSLSKDHLLIKDYSALFPREEFLPLIRGIASLEGQNNVRLNKNYLDLVDHRIKAASSGYQEFQLAFPKMEVAA